MRVWYKQPHLAKSDWTLALGEAAHLLHIEQSVCNRLTSHLHSHSGELLDGSGAPWSNLCNKHDLQFLTPLCPRSGGAQNKTPRWTVACTYVQGPLWHGPLLRLCYMLSVCVKCAAAYLEPGHSCGRHVESQ